MTRIGGCHDRRNGWECERGLENVESVLESRGFRHLNNPSLQEAVGRIAREHASGAGFCERLQDFLHSGELAGLSGYLRGKVLEGVTSFSDESALDRLQHLAGDEEGDEIEVVGIRGEEPAPAAAGLSGYRGEPRVLPSLHGGGGRLEIWAGQPARAALPGSEAVR